MTIFSAFAPAPKRRTRPAPRAQQRRRPWVSLAIPVVLSLSFVSYLYLYQLPTSNVHPAALQAKTATLHSDQLVMDKRVDLTVIGGGLAGAYTALYSRL